MSRRSCRTAVPLAASGFVLLVAHAAGLLAFVLPAVPLLLLLASLLWGVYPGCDTIVRLSERLRSARRPRATSVAARPPRPWSIAASGGLLIAFGRAERPPPLAA
ncbi:MAG TPA: hypothetical protein VFU04_08830 [Solirubrobacterales bacterium]|nr:hypothetical protein [Solirubrobacterales bacterium]